MFPETFSSQQEYDNYLCCKGKIRLGDKVSLYIEGRYGGFACNHHTMDSNNITEPFLVIATMLFNHAYEFVIGSEIQQYGLYSGSFFPSTTIADVNKYRFRYVLIDTDCRIAKIIKGTK
jgi:hypothetical protein